MVLSTGYCMLQESELSQEIEECKTRLGEQQERLEAAEVEQNELKQRLTETQDAVEKEQQESSSLQVMVTPGVNR